MVDWDDLQDITIEKQEKDEKPQQKIAEEEKGRGFYFKPGDLLPKWRKNGTFEPVKQEKTIKKPRFSKKTLLLSVICAFLFIVWIATLSANAELNQQRENSDVERNQAVSDLEGCVNLKSAIQTDLTNCQNKPTPPAETKTIYMPCNNTNKDTLKYIKEIARLEKLVDLQYNQTFLDLEDDLRDCEEELEECEDE